MGELVYYPDELGYKRVGTVRAAASATVIKLPVISYGRDSASRRKRKQQQTPAAQQLEQAEADLRTAAYELERATLRRDRLARSIQEAVEACAMANAAVVDARERLRRAKLAAAIS